MGEGERGIGIMECWNTGFNEHHSIYSNIPIFLLSIIRLIELHPVFLAHPFLDKSLGFRVDLESLLDGFFEAIAAQ